MTISLQYYMQFILLRPNGPAVDKFFHVGNIFFLAQSNEACRRVFGLLARGWDDCMQLLYAPQETQMKCLTESPRNEAETCPPSHQIAA